MQGYINLTEKTTLVRSIPTQENKEFSFISADNNTKRNDNFH